VRPLRVDFVRLGPGVTSPQIARFCSLPALSEQGLTDRHRTWEQQGIRGTSFSGDDSGFGQFSSAQRVCDTVSRKLDW
jgi:hypothetical protein